jgi:hypothetical protein
MIEQQPCDKPAAALLEMEVWGLVSELATPLIGHGAIPSLIALRIVLSHCIRQTEDPAYTLRLLIADLNTALAQQPARFN